MFYPYSLTPFGEVGSVLASSTWRKARSIQAPTGIPASPAAAVTASRVGSLMPLITQPPGQTSFPLSIVPPR
jgi:hypothetical protein